ncbi:MAG TPA: preprotein translocase subunit SecA [Candidatus Hydrogenedentes bacterium]|nr:preprotein translocase subunit SecA [Candidatus Hydrogenedentota bacterium]HPG68213.1 preprotein translocase subunit SecA [Candidatus Hydrogenedentota bacterium]
MLNSLLKSVFGTSTERQIKKLEPMLEAVRNWEARFQAMDNDQLRAQTGVFKERLAQGATLDDILPEGFAAVRETAKRVVGMRPFDVQVIGGIVLHQGSIAEMVTGEGKTLVATMPVYLNALDGRGVHVVTVNDYLARRDSEWMGPVYRFLGLTVGLIQHYMDTFERQVAYRADITYGTNNEFGFDYLRDNSALRPEMRVQRELNYAIIDEVDSILVDEARTPLIISGRPEKSTDLYYKVDDAVRRLRRDQHFEIEEKHQQVLLTDEGMETVEKLLGVDDLFVGDQLGVVHMIEQALRAHNFFRRDDEYMVRNGEVLIVDEFTGRAMEGRRYSDGLHQALEAKERVAVQFETQTIASITYQNLFKLYNKIAGMTGTAATEAMEFDQIYGLDVVQIPTNLPLIRRDGTDLVFATEAGKYRHVVDEIANVHETGRPVLVGTVSIEKSELVAELLKERGITEFEVLNAKHHEREAAIVGNAGKVGAITIATNMAGRGTDIKLAEGVRELGGLSIVGTERHESRRIDNQLRGRCGRQGDPGTTRFYVSLEDEVARLFGGDKVKKMLTWFGSEEMDDEPLSQKMVSRTIERAQRQVEEYNFEIRKHLKEYDDVMNKQRQIIYSMRRDVLEDRDITQQLHEMFESLVNEMTDNYTPEDTLPEEWDLEGLDTAFRRVFGFVPDMAGRDDGAPKPMPERLLAQVLTEYTRREGVMADIIRESFREQIGGDESRIDFGRLARKRIHDYEMMALLRAVDDKWIDHLYSMDYLRESVRLRAYGQRDPLLEYKTEGFEMFEEMMRNIEENVAQTLFRLTDPEILRTRQIRARRGMGLQENDPFAQLSRYTYVGADKTQDHSFAAYDTSRFALAGQDASAQSDDGGPEGARPKPRMQPIRVGPKVGPNDPCPCGSGKKYKKCCGRQIQN